MFYSATAAEEGVWSVSLNQHQIKTWPVLSLNTACYKLIQVWQQSTFF